MASQVKSRVGFLYILRPQVLINGERIVKIGSTTRTVAERIRQLESRSSVVFDLIYSVEVEDARGLEKQLHAKYTSRRMSGGSEGFFHMEPEEIVPEIEKVAEELSRSSSKKARNAEFSAFCKNIGATRFKASVGVASHIIWFLASILFGFGAVVYTPFDIPDGLRAYAIAGSLVVAAVVVKLGLLAVNRLIDDYYFTHRFGPAISAKNQELSEKYPHA
ncbi:MAG TPA: GIY-YIG nuclease family protein [Aliidongia sp.]|uniref:GIY-YIG nuclease family protein n=1 Tax=Aliidongia sp. TaxID=1914230 RepID=UPI002DDDB4B3|nr:GIY-YIG nuclease family protein [Aliidongia sp.]HEV2674521.1 GIY-YIG nuclease family protein [Aliidongia sp.]